MRRLQAAKPLPARQALAQQQCLTALQLQRGRLAARLLPSPCLHKILLLAPLHQLQVGAGRLQHLVQHLQQRLVCPAARHARCSSGEDGRRAAFAGGPAAQGNCVVLRSRPLSTNTANSPFNTGTPLA